MPIGVGDKIPDVALRVMGPEGPGTVQSGEVLGSGRVVLFGVPERSPRVARSMHLPGFVRQADELSAKGVDTIACIAVNDAWVMDAWGKDQGVGDKIVMLADGNGDFADAMGLSFDGGGFGLGKRTKRYAAVIEDGIVTHLDVDEAGGVNVSSCEAVLQRI